MPIGRKRKYSKHQPKRSSPAPPTEEPQEKRAAAVAAKTAISQQQQQLEEEEKKQESVDLLDEALQARVTQPVLEESARRTAIAYLFVHVYGCPPESEWKGRDGVIPLIKQTLNIPKNTNIKYILKDVLAAQAIGEVYTGSHKAGTFSGRRPQIEIDSDIAQMFADLIEEGSSLETAREIINLHRAEEGLELFNVSTIYSLSKRLEPKVTSVSSTSQGNRDATSAWARARKNWVTQLMLRLGTMKLDELTPEEQAKPCFNLDMDKYGIDLEQVGWWDETHRKCEIGGMGTGKDYQILFKRDSDGKLSPDGEYSDPKKKAKMKIKYDNEGRFCLGMGQKMTVSGEAHGDRLPMFDYSGKVILGIKDYEAKQKKEIARVKALKTGHQGGWIDGERPEGVLYRNDPVDMLKGVAKQTKAKFAAVGVNTVGDLKSKTMADLTKLVTDHSVTSSNKLMHMWAQADACMEEDAPVTVDYRTAANPYEARYGADWEEQIKPSVTMKNCVHITDMVDHIFQSTADYFKGTKYEDTWLVYHDALSLMTSIDCVEWMKEKGWYEHWLLPVEGLNTEKELQRFAGLPIGNTPEMMPWDCSCNNDVTGSVNRHVMINRHLEEDDPRKFSLSTPKRCSAAYSRILQGCPPSNRIVGDIRKVVTSMKAIREANGAYVPGLGNRKGRRQQEVGGQASRTSANWGGKREKKKVELSDQWWHPDARPIMKERVNASKSKLESKLDQTDEEEDIIELEEDSEVEVEVDNAEYMEDDQE